jgi:RNA 3'-terminal phosphate cyclase
MREKRKLSPLEKNYLDRPKGKLPSGETIAFVLGILALITPAIIDSVLHAITGADLPTKFVVNGVTYDSREITVDFFKNMKVNESLGK